MSKRRLAVLIAGMLVGAPIGIAAVTGMSTPAEQPAEAPLPPEAAQPAPTEQTEALQSTPADQTASTGQQAVAEVGYVVPARPRTLADATFPPLESDVFPPSTDERPLLPSVAAYLDRKAASTLLADAGAREPVFPASDEDRMLPTQIAYFEALEARRIAAAEAELRQAELREAQLREAQLRQAQQSAGVPVSAPATLSADVPAEASAEANIDRVAENVRQ